MKKIHNIVGTTVHVRLLTLFGCVQACPNLLRLSRGSLWVILATFPGKNISELKIS